MLVERNIPSYIKIQDKKVKVWYRGQVFSCARCYRSFRDCPGRAVAKACQAKNPSLKVEFNDVWENIKNETPFRQMMTEEEEFSTETLKIFSFPKEASRKDVHDWVRDQGVTIPEEKIVPTNTSTAWFLVHVGKDNMKFIINQLNRKECGHGKEKRYIQCVPECLNTPHKQKLGLRPPQDQSFESAASAAARHLQPSEKDIMEASTSNDNKHHRENIT